MYVGACARVRADGTCITDLDGHFRLRSSNCIVVTPTWKGPGAIPVTLVEGPAFMPAADADDDMHSAAPPAVAIALLRRIATRPPVDDSAHVALNTVASMSQTSTRTREHLI